MTIFDILDNILKNKNQKVYEEHIVSSDFFKTYNNYMIQRWLSMCSCKDILKCLSENQELLESIKNKEQHYKVLMKIVPQHKNIYLKYVK